MTETFAGSFTVTAKVDKARRRIIGLVAPYGEVGNPSRNGDPVKLRVEAGGIVYDDPNQVKLVIDHLGQHPQIAGRARDLIATDEGIVGTFAVVKTHIGDQALIEAEEGLRTGLSIEADADSPLPTDDDGVYVASADNPLRLRRVALVETPAFDSAQVHEVAASHSKETAMAEKVTAAEVPDDQLAEIAGTLGDIAGSLQALIPGADTAADDATEASRPARVPAVAVTAATSVTREPFVYGHPGAEGQSFFADLYHAKTDSVAAARVAKAEQMWQIAAADEAIVKTDVTIPNVYQDALTVQQLQFPRDLADNIPGTAISSARPVLIPEVQGVTADGGSGEVVAAHVENTNPSAGEVDIDYQTHTPAPYSGKFDIGREALDAGSPGMDQLLFGFLRESYNRVTEAAAVTAVTGASGIDTGSSTTDADLQVEARNLEKTIRQELAAFKARRAAPADIIWANPTLYAGLVGYDASDGRPILPYVGPSNTSGSAPQANYDGLSLMGVPLVNATYMTAAKVVVARRGDIHKFESPLLQFRWEEVAGPAKVRFVAFGYFLVGVLQAKGVCLITQA